MYVQYHRRPRENSSEQLPIGFGLFFKWQGISAGCGGHAPEAEGAGHDGTAHRHGKINTSTHGRDRAAEGVGNDLGGFLAGGDKGAAQGDSGQQGGEVGGGDHLKEGVGGVVAEAADFAGGVVKS